MATKVSISETYALGCTECEDRLLRTVRWSCRDSQVKGLSMKLVPRCEHALPAIAGKAETKVQAIRSAIASNEAPPPPPPGQLFAAPENTSETLAGTGYDEPQALIQKA